MATTTFPSEDVATVSRGMQNGRDRQIDVERDHSFERTVETSPKAGSWMIIFAGAIAPLGLAGAAVATTYLTQHERVAITAWIAVAVAGTASVIASAAVSHRRIVSVDRDNEGRRSFDAKVDRNRNSDVSRTRSDSD